MSCAVQSFTCLFSMFPPGQVLLSGEHLPSSAWKREPARQQEGAVWGEDQGLSNQSPGLRVVDSPRAWFLLSSENKPPVFALVGRRLVIPQSLMQAFNQSSLFGGPFTPTSRGLQWGSSGGFNRLVTLFVGLHRLGLLPHIEGYCCYLLSVFSFLVDFCLNKIFFLSFQWDFNRTKSRCIPSTCCLCWSYSSFLSLL